MYTELIVDDFDNVALNPVYLGPIYGSTVTVLLSYRATPYENAVSPLWAFVILHDVVDITAAVAELFQAARIVFQLFRDPVSLATSAFFQKLLGFLYLAGENVGQAWEPTDLPTAQHLIGYGVNPNLFIECGL